MKRGCLRCKVLITLPSGKEVEAYMSITMDKTRDSRLLNDVVKGCLRRYHEMVCDNFGGACKVKIIEPCQLAQECG